MAEAALVPPSPSFKPRKEKVQFPRSQTKPQTCFSLACQPTLSSSEPITKTHGMMCWWCILVTRPTLRPILEVASLGPLQSKIELSWPREVEVDRYWTIKPQTSISHQVCQFILQVIIVSSNKVNNRLVCKVILNDDLVIGFISGKWNLSLRPAPLIQVRYQNIYLFVFQTDSCSKPYNFSSSFPHCIWPSERVE